MPPLSSDRKALIWSSSSMWLSFVSNLANTYQAAQVGAQVLLEQHTRQKQRGLRGSTFRALPGPTSSTNAFSFSMLCHMETASAISVGWRSPELDLSAAWKMRSTSASEGWAPSLGRAMHNSGTTNKLAARAIAHAKSALK